jgi:hypothetical protein|tara:strand:+ start:373 stop:1365 length:993 start_codon:yes stop_codon:yes gene_type:complete
MANTLKIKRNTWNNSSTPSGLSYGELAWDNAGETLYIGKQTDGGGTVSSVKVSTEATTSVKGLASFNSANFAVSNGDVTIKNLGVATAELQDLAVTTAKIGNDAVTLGSKTSGNYVAAITGGTGITNVSAASEGASHTLSVNLDELSTVTSVANNDYIVTVDFATGNTEKMQLEVIENKLFAAVSGDIAISSSGVASISAGSIVTADIANDQVTGDKLANDITIANDLIVSGDLTVQGDTTTINTATLAVEDKDIVIASGASDSSAANNAGIIIGSDVASIKYVHSGTKWALNKNTAITGTLAVSSTSAFTGAITASGGFANTTFDGGTF